MMKMFSTEKQHPTILRSNQEYQSPFRSSIFLAGPSLRGENVKTPWREEAIEILEQKRFNGEIYVPEPFASDYGDQFYWEKMALDCCGCILFWIPRNLEILPGFTTNVEFGEWMNSGKVVLGYPKDAVNMRYLHLKAEEREIPVTHTLGDTVENALRLLSWRDRPMHPEYL